MICSLIGVKHVGKSTLLQQLTSHGTCFDLDTEMLTEYTKNSSQRHVSVRTMYQQLGNTAFHLLENQILDRLLKKIDQANKVDLAFIATGGGIAENSDSLRLLQQHTTIIHLYLDFETIWKRIKRKGMPAFVADNPRDELQDLFETRMHVYNEIAHYNLNADLPIKTQVKKVLEVIS